MSKNYYDTLGVSKNATQDEIKKAFRKLAHEHHPDKKSGNEAKFKEINEAYQILGNEEKRKQYDQFGSTFNSATGGTGGFNNAQGFGGGGFNWQDFARQNSGGGGGFSFNGEEFDLGDIFGDVFGFGGGHSRSRTKSYVGEDIEIVLTIDFKEAIFGAEKIIYLEKYDTCENCQGSGAEVGSKISTCPECKGTGQIRQAQRTIFGTIATNMVCPTCNGAGEKPEKFCSKCHGSGRVKNKKEIKISIPTGIDENQQIKISGGGHTGEKKHRAGDLYVSFRINKDKKFVRQGQNILTKLNIDFVQATLGDKIEIETLDGAVNLKIPEATQTGKILVLKDQGVPELNRPNRRGDLLVEIFVKTPEKISRKAKKLLEELKNELA
ncbi:MAG TPA: molecular chaperone DnaJ [bacterium]|nr:molecular chaperone DnaJ [bacterium]